MVTTERVRVYDPAAEIRPRPIDAILQAGDIAACYGADTASKIITFGTMSLSPLPQGRLRFSPSHVAMICENTPATAAAGYFAWAEATTFCNHRCIINNRPVAGCQAHAPETRVRDYLEAGGRVDLYRLVDLDKLSADESDLVSRILLDYFVARRINYDLGGAIVSGVRNRLFRALWQFNDLNSVFCSEMIAGVLQRIGRANRSNPARFHPGRLLRESVAAGVYCFNRQLTIEDLH